MNNDVAQSCFIGHKLNEITISKRQHALNIELNYPSATLKLAGQMNEGIMFLCHLKKPKQSIFSVVLLFLDALKHGLLCPIR